MRGKIAQLPRLHAGMIVLGPPWPLLFESPHTVAQYLGGMLRLYPQVNAVAVIRRLPASDTPAHVVRRLIGEHVLITAPRWLIYIAEIILVRNTTRVYRAADAFIDRLFVDLF